MDKQTTRDRLNVAFTALYPLADAKETLDEYQRQRVLDAMLAINEVREAVREVE